MPRERAFNTKFKLNYKGWLLVVMKKHRVGGGGLVLNRTTYELTRN